MSVSLNIYCVSPVKVAVRFLLLTLAVKCASSVSTHWPARTEL